MKKLFTVLLLLCSVVAWGQNADRVNVVIDDARVNDVVGQGRFIGYVADILKEQVQLAPSVRLLDMESWKQNPQSALHPKYILRVTMQKPDIVNEANGGSLDVFTLGRTKNTVMQLKSVVNMSVNVVDFETSEVVFSCASTGKASGKVNVQTELSVLGISGAAHVNDGVENYRHSLSGQAIQKASQDLGGVLRLWFAGEISEKVVDHRETASFYNSENEQMAASGKYLYLGNRKIDEYNAEAVFMGNQDLYLKFNRARKLRKNCWVPGTCLGACGSIPFSMGVAFLIIGEDFGEIAPVLATSGALMLAGGITWSVRMSKKSKKLYNEIASQYNARNLHRSQNSSDFEIKLSPNSIAFTF